MSFSVRPISTNNITFTARQNDDSDNRKVTTSEVATATGATGAVIKGSRNGAFDMFKSSSKVGQMSKNTTEAIRMARKPVSQVKGLFPKFMQAFRNTKGDIIKWADGIKNSSFLKPLLKSKAFEFVAGGLGAIMGIFVTITGIGDIANTISGYTNK